MRIAQDAILGKQPIKPSRPIGAHRNLLTHPIAPRHPTNRLVHRLARIANNADLRPRRHAQLGRQNQPLTKREIPPVSDPLFQVLRHVVVIEVRFFRGLILPVDCRPFRKSSTGRWPEKLTPCSPRRSGPSSSRKSSCFDQTSAL